MSTDENLYGRSPELSAKMLDLLASDEARSGIMSTVDSAVSYFGNSVLLKEVADAIRDRLDKPSTQVETEPWRTVTRSPEDYLPPTTSVVYASKQGEPVIRIGGVEDTNGDPEIQSITFSQGSISRSPEEPVHTTDITFLGLTDSDNRLNPFQRLYFMPTGQLPSQGLPPAGVFVDFRQFDILGTQRARAFGTVGRNLGGESSKLSLTCYPRKSFPFAGEHIDPDDPFSMGVDARLLPSIAGTLQPGFFSGGLYNNYQQVRKRQGKS